MKAKTDFTQMGIAALLPGMQYVVDQMQALLNDMRESLGALQNGQPREKSRKGGWAGMTAEERSAEMARRRRKGKTIARKDWPAKARKTQKSYWAKLSPEERSKEMKRRIAKRTAA